MEKKKYKALLIMNITSILLLVVTWTVLYMVWFQLQLVDQNSVEDARRLTNDIANQRECLKRQDFDCPAGKYVSR